MKKKSIILTIISIIIVTLLTMYITTLAVAPNEIGATQYIGIGYPETKLKKMETGKEMSSAVNLMSSKNYEYFCANHETRFGNTQYAIKHILSAKAEIKGNTTKVVAKSNKNSSNYESGPFTESTKNSGNSTLAF